MSYKKNIRLYIAHQVSERKKIKEICDGLEREFFITCVNPFYSISRPEIDMLDTLKTKEEQDNYKKTWTYDDCKKIVETDLSLIDSADGILAFLTRGVLGSAMEVQYAKITNKRIYIITDTYNYHPWIRYYADEIFRNIDEFKDYLKKRGYERNRT